MAEDGEKTPGWAENPLYEQAVAHFEAEEWEEAIALFSQLATEYPEDQELQQILADLRLKASLSRGEGRRGRMWTRRQGRRILLVLGIVALIVVLAGASYGVYQWLLQAQARAIDVAYRDEKLELARGYVAAGDYARAADLYKELLDLDPNDETAADGLERAEQLQELAAACDRALQLTREEQWYEALWLWRWIRAMDPNFCDVDYWIAFVERQEDLHPWFADAEMRYNIQDWSGAIEALERLRGQNANYRRDEVEALLVRSLVNLAEQILGDASDPTNVYNQIMELFDRAIQIHPLDESVLAERAVAEAYSQSFARFQEEGCEGALLELQSVYGNELESATTQQFELVYQANIHCGDERMAAGDFQGARVCYEAAIELPVEDVSEATTKYEALVPMLTPTATPRPPSPTPTRPPATATPRPTATPTLYYSLPKPPEPLPQCEFTFVEGTVWQDYESTQIQGARVKVWSEGWEVTLVTPTHGDVGSGYYKHIFSTRGPLAGNWFVAVVDANGSPLSETVAFDTNTLDCVRIGGPGRQWWIIDFEANY